MDALTYKAGDTVSLSGSDVVCGVTTSAGTQVTVFIPLSRPIVATSVKATGKFYVRNGSTSSEATVSNLTGNIRANGVEFAFPVTTSVGTSWTVLTVGLGVTLTFA